MRNPFRPTAGARPPDLIGRPGILDAFGNRLAQGSSTSTIITGARGVGKTVMLGAAQDLAGRSGWEVISETATPGVAGRIEESLRRLIAARCGPPEPGLLEDTQTLFERLRGAGMGLIITIDEIHAVGNGDLPRLAAFTEDGAALVVAGLPSEVSGLLNEDPAAFLRQAERIVLHNVDVADVEESFARTFAAGGFDAPAGAVRQAAEATAGYPFLVQLVGYFLWKEVEGGAEMTATAVGRAVEKAQQRYARTIP
ncbi:ATP-binding protein [Pseudarthrobacter sp. MDT3-26]|uniref:ATP-binding protein n=1 Tax=Pseudarthrobacter raffinosi TaxID=2953651 RepID=UPI00208E0207|nr:ATP-binding protein [Pseudarthrobacter sp. MDT3-26]MCO4263758.1 ATP-binding protein [Pseudarthrobacter sp. MDT3-26]